MTFKEDIKRPFNLVMALITVFALAYTIIYDINSRRYRNISYQINQPIAKIFDSQNSTSALKLFERDSIPVTENVYLLTGIIWNNGNLPITKEDVREAISLKLTNSKRILDFKIVKQYDPSISNFVLAKKDSNTLSLKWTYFDPGFGFRFQIIYTGKEVPGFELKGKILSVKSFKNLEHKENKSIWSQIGMLFLFLLFILIFASKFRKEKLSVFWQISNIFFVVLFILFFLVTLFAIFLAPTFLPNF